MTIIHKEKTQFSPGLLAMLPVFYIGWSDSVLSPSEISLLHSRINSMKFLSLEEKEYLIRWTDPKNPPGPEIFKEWVTAIRLHASRINATEKKSISDFCYAMAVSVVPQEKDLAERPLIREAVITVEQMLGLDNTASLKLLLDRIDSKYEIQKESVGFDIDLLEKTLDGPYRATKQFMRKLLQDPHFRLGNFPLKEDHRAAVLQWIKSLAAQGLGAYSFPVKYGGGEKAGAHLVVFEMLAYHDLSLTVKFGVQFGLFGGAIYGLGTESHHKLYLDPLGKAELLGCFAMTETGHGSNVKGIKTTATYGRSDDTIAIHTPEMDAGKEYIGNALHASMAVVFAQLHVDGENQGVHAVLVPLRDKNGDLLPGIKIEDNGYKMGLNGVDNGRIWFDQVKVPRTHLLDRYGGINPEGIYYSSIENPNKRFFTMLGALVTGRISVAKAGVNVAKSALAIAIKYALKRRQFEGKDESKETLIMDYPSHQQRLLPLLAATYAYDISISRLAEDHINATETEKRKIETQAAGLKAMATWHVTRTIQECREACGGKGYLSENRIPELKADSDIFTTFEGDNTVLMQLVAKGLLTEFKQSFHDEGVKAVIMHIGHRMSTAISALNPYYSRLTSTSHLLDKDFHLHALKFRQDKLFITLASRMRDFLNKRIHPHDAFLKCQVHMIGLARAYVEKLVYEDFLLFIDNADPSLRGILGKLGGLYALSAIEADKGWYLETGYMEGQKTKAIRRVREKLCRELRYEVSGLVDAWAIPSTLLGAEIIT